MQFAIKATLNATLIALAAFSMAQPAMSQVVMGDREREVRDAMRRATTYFLDHVSTHGGYVYHYSLDLRNRWGEGQASPDQIWVQPPGTPTVGMALLAAYKSTNDEFYLDGARAAAYALCYGQLRSGGWTNCIDFSPAGDRVAQYRGQSKKGKNHSSLDDGQTQSALAFLIRMDAELEFRDARIHSAASAGLESLLAAQFPNGAFPQVWNEPVVAQPARVANFPTYDWRTEGRIKEYWNLYTLNDDLAGTVAETLLAAAEVYQDPRYTDALRQLGDFLIVAQMPAPQPAWSQQYNYDMQPIWARRFEPPGVSGDETQEVIETLMTIATVTNDRKYLEPIPAALAWLKRSQLGDGRLARYYELKTNRPLYMEREGKVYSLTYDDSNLPAHYGWKTELKIGELSAKYKQFASGVSSSSINSREPSPDEVRSTINQLDERGRWISTFDGTRLVGQAKMPIGTEYLSSQIFSDNVTMLSQFLKRSN